MGHARLRRSADIRAALSSRSVTHGKHAVVHVRARCDGGEARVAVMAGRKVGNAVRRNRAKRRLRAVVASKTLPKGLDVVVVARASAATVGFPTLVHDVEASLPGVVVEVGVPLPAESVR